MNNEISPEDKSDNVKGTKKKHYKNPPGTINTPAGPGPDFHSTRHDVEEEEDPWLTNPPRLGRRESEPHSFEITRIYDILATNFKDDRTIWDLHHYFEKDGEKLSENSLRYIVTKVFRKVGIKVTPHQLRHSYATSLLNGGAPIVDVSELLGHSSMATTQIYTKLGSALKQQNYNKAHPLCGLDD